MIDYTPAARRQVSGLIARYRRKQRPEAIRNLRAALARVEAAIESGSGRFREFPATYRNLTRPGRAWIKDAIYWVAYERSEPPIIVAVFWQGSDLDRRYPDVP